MSDFKVIVPEATTNLVTNPSIEVDTTGYTAVGGSIARSTAQSKFGVASLAITPTSGTTDGAYYGTVSLTNGQIYTKSVWVLGVNGVPYRIYFGSTGGGVLGTPTEFTGTGEWQLVEVTYTETSTTTRRLYVVKNSSASTGVFYIDGLLCENKSYSTTYCDGSLVGNRADGYLWTGAAHASTSTRHAQERSGGRVRDMVDDLGVTAVNSFIGGGSPEETINTEELALLPGELYQNSKVGARFIDLGLTFKGSTVADLHANRKALKAAIRRNLVSPSQPFVFRYTGGPRTLEIDSWYAGGLGQKDLNKFVEQTPARLFCPQPYWRGLGQAAKSLTVQQTVADADYIIQRDASGNWSALGTGITGSVVTCFAIGPDGSVYVGGNFTSAGGVANTAHIAKWNPVTSTWSALGTGMNSFVNALAIGPDGSVYATGNFTSAGGVANTAHIAKWNGSAWVALGTGLGNDGNALAIGLDGSVYVGGSFTTAGGGAANRIAKWNGSAWSALGSGLNDTVSALAVGPDGSIYVGGNFTTAGGISTNNTAKWNPSTSAWSAMNGGLGSALAVGPGGTVYSAAGTQVYKWTGSQWAALGSGMNASSNVICLTILPNGSLLAGGDFTTAGGVTLPDGIAQWNGSTWLPLGDANLPGTAEVWAIAATSDGKLYLGFTTSGSATTGVVTTVTYGGTADAFPRFVVTGPGRLYQLVNYTTGQAIYFDLTLLSGETVTLDLDPQQAKFTSTFRGNIIQTIINGSSVADWHLQPGDNSIGIFVDDATAVAYLVWRELYEAADG